MNFSMSYIYISLKHAKNKAEQTILYVGEFIFTCQKIKIYGANQVIFIQAKHIKPYVQALQIESYSYAFSDYLVQLTGSIKPTLYVI